jgi:hypothetical protein
MCGDCCSGCNYAAKNTVLTNYLPDAFNGRLRLADDRIRVDWHGADTEPIFQRCRGHPACACIILIFRAALVSCGLSRGRRPPS